MTPIQKQGNYYLLTIDQDLASEAYLRQFLALLEFRALAKKNQMTREQAEELSEELKEDWWQAHQHRFLEE